METEQNPYYIYIYFDQRKTGEWKFRDKIFIYQPFYIGKGKKNRIRYHLQSKSLSNNSTKSNKISKIIRETGELPIHYKIYENLTFEEANQLEIEIIQTFGRIDLKTGFLTNMTDGGEGSRNIILSDETRKKISEVKKGKKCGINSHLSKCVIQSTLDGVFIKKWDYLSDIQKQTGMCAKNISRCCLNKTKQAFGFKWCYDGTTKYEPIIKAACIDRRKKVYQYSLKGDFVREWESVACATNANQNTHISRCCLGKFRQTGGYQWFYEFKGKSIPAIAYCANSKINII